MDVEQSSILVVDDDPKLRDLLAQYLGREGFRVRTANDGNAMDQLLAQSPPDLVVLDLMLPGEDGLSIARRLRSGTDIPVIILSARGDEVDRIVGLEVGADDYLAKPFSPRELLARIRAVLRRQRIPAVADETATVAFGDFVLDLDGQRLLRNGHEVELTAGDFALLEVLVTHPNRVMSRDQLVDRIKGYERSPYDRSIDVRVTRLRRKIEPDPASPVFIRTVWGRGYMFTPHGDRPGP
jgi:two-component system, OmpR family, phosphate regulon response regulator OmpR